MNKILQHLFLFFCLCTISTGMTQDMQLFNLSALNQHNWTNPGKMKQDTNFTVIMPNGALHAMQKGPAFGKFLTPVNDTLLALDLDAIQEDFESENLTHLDAKVHVLGLDYRFGKSMLSVGYNLNFTSYLNYTKDFIDLFNVGNSAFIGETMKLGPSFSVMSYHEVYLGYARSFGNISVGTRIKYLSGIDNLSTGNSQIDLFTNPDIYQLEFTNDYVVHSAGGFNYNNLDDFSVEPNFGNINNFGSNTGMAIDIGINYQMTDKLSVGLSIIDLGNIKWTDRSVNHRASGNASFIGIDLVEYLDNKEGDIIIKDSIYQLLKFTSDSINYQTNLKKRYYLGANYELTNKWNLHASYANSSYGTTAHYAFGIGAFGDINQSFACNFQYTYSNFGGSNLGLGMVLTAGKSQLYLLADNILKIQKIDDANYTSVRIGLNFSVGGGTYRKKIVVPETSIEVLDTSGPADQ